MSVYNRRTPGSSLPAAEIAQLGQRIQSRRLERGVTLEVMSRRTGFSKGYLSRIENGRKVPPLSTLSRIAVALGTDAHALLVASATHEGVPQYHLLRVGDRYAVDRAESAFGYRYEALAPNDGRACMEPFIVHLPRAIDRHVFFEHDGEEFIYVLAGRVAWQIGHERHVLAVGDALLLDSRLPHRACAIDGDASALIVLLPRRQMPPVGVPPAGEGAGGTLPGATS